MKQPKPNTSKYLDLIRDIETGYIKIPQFQRDFVWDIQATAKLLDSIVKGYPIGTFTIWKTREKLKSVRNIGEDNLPATPNGDFVQYVLDGQQRITSLYVALKGLIILKEDKPVNYKDIYIDLNKEVDDSEPIVTTDKIDTAAITIHELLYSNLTYLVDNYRDYINKIDIYQKRFNTYDFSTIILEDYPMDVAVEIFTRINTTGTELTLFEIMCATTYDESRNFDMKEKYAVLQEELADVKYDIPGPTLLQCLSLNLAGECTRKTILKLDKDQIIDIWTDTIESIKEAIDYFRTVYRIPVERLLPYSALIVPFSYFFFKNRHKPNSDQARYLQEYFWRSSLSYRFSSAVESKLGQDAKRMDQIICNQRPEYLNFNLTLDKEHIKNLWFSTSNSYCKAILCLFAYFEPKSFNNNATVILDNSWLKVSNSRNYHHFFPRAYLKNKKIVNENSVANITLVDDHLNKREIQAKAPSDYMKKFKRSNSVLDQTMRTHLIDDLNDFGIWRDNYERFLEKRSERIYNELKQRIDF